MKTVAIILARGGSKGWGKLIYEEPIETLYIGKRDILHKYKASDLDSDFDWTHEK